MELQGGGSNSSANMVAKGGRSGGNPSHGRGGGGRDGGGHGGHDGHGNFQ
jgi:hypothetical protein